MTFTTLLALMAASLLLGLVARGRARTPILLAASTLALFALQPNLPIRGMDFWLPLSTLGLAFLVWMIVMPRGEAFWQHNWLAVVIPVAIILALGVVRIFGLDVLLPSSRAPSLAHIGIALAGIAVAGLLLSGRAGKGRVALFFGVAILLVVFVFLKVPALGYAASVWFRSLNQQSTLTASAFDIRWLGFSYIAFRLLHVLRDRQNGRLAPVPLGDFLVYVIFFPALAAGPIDRLERFVKDLGNPAALDREALADAGRRLLLGLFKKFVLADSLALVALNQTNAPQVQGAFWAWVVLYAYAFQIFFDFSGYTDLAIGMGRLMGFKLPENFNQPLRKPNLTQFWNNWHMTLTQWFRAYFFNPVTRALRTGRMPIPVVAMILITQVATMVLIGLWHGVTWNFVLWGLWHGLGLFVHNRWAEWMKSRNAQVSSTVQKAAGLLNVFVTFNYVALGWVFFALPSVTNSLRYFGVLFTGGQP